MHGYDFYSIDKLGTTSLISIASVSAETPLDAMKCFFRERKQTFYHVSWFEKFSTYSKGEEVIIAIPTRVFPARKRVYMQEAYQAFFVVTTPKACDCGSEATYGKSDAHSSWCSIRSR